jgi:predicted double-glycine peptidase
MAKLGVESLDLPDVRQSHNYDCGAAVAMAVGRYFGVGPANEEAWIGLVGAIPEAGTPAAGIVQAMRDLGLSTIAASDMNVEDLADFVNAGHPVICSGQYLQESQDETIGHFVVVVGVAADEVFLQDPLAGRVSLPADKFVALWHDWDPDGTALIRFGIAVGNGSLELGVRSQVSSAAGSLSANGVSHPAPPYPRLSSQESM